MVYINSIDITNIKRAIVAVSADACLKTVQNWVLRLDFCKCNCGGHAKKNFHNALFEKPVRTRKFEKSNMYQCMKMYVCLLKFLKSLNFRNKVQLVSECYYSVAKFLVQYPWLVGISWNVFIYVYFTCHIHQGVLRDQQIIIIIMYIKSKYFVKTNIVIQKFDLLEHSQYEIEFYGNDSKFRSLKKNTYLYFHNQNSQIIVL